MKRRRGLLWTLTVTLALCGACGVWLRVQQGQYARNRQLIDALEHNNTETALALVNAGADPNTRSEPTPAPTLLQLLRHLFHHSPAPTNDSMPAFTYACIGVWKPVSLQTNIKAKGWPLFVEDVPLVEAMLTHGANLHALDENKCTALHQAMFTRHVRTAERLLAHGANINAQSPDGETPLMWAIRAESTDGARLLLTHGANTNLQSASGDTALHLCLVYDKTGIVMPLLLAHGADPTLRNRSGITAIQFARLERRPDLARLLKRGAK